MFIWINSEYDQEMKAINNESKEKFIKNFILEVVFIILFYLKFQECLSKENSFLVIRI